MVSSTPSISPARHDAQAQPEPASIHRPLLEIGIVVAGRLPPSQARAIRQGAGFLEQRLAELFPAFDWRIKQRRRRDIGEFSREESSLLLHLAAEERDTHRWDLALLITADELIPHYRPFALAALSRPLDAAVLSIARLTSDSDEPNDEQDIEQISQRLLALMLTALAHLGGAGARDEPTSLLHRPDVPDDLDAMVELDAPAQADLLAAFSDMADQRLEELAGGHGRFRFLLRAIWINREEIGEALWAARPWEFPSRLSRLTTAAVSTVAILLTTAESWDLALSQSGLTLALLALGVWCLTTLFVSWRQQLWLHRHRTPRATEQRVVTRISALLIVASGLLLTWVCLWLLAWLASLGLFSHALIASWAASSGYDPTLGLRPVHAVMACYTASIALLIGSLGASFEDQHHFQHVVFVDDEL